MMGPQTGAQDRLFYSFNLDVFVPRDHLLRGIDRGLDLSDLRDHLAPFYSHTGRPSIDPELMIRMLIIGYCFGIRSERRLCEEVQLNLAYRWFCRLGLEDEIPDHSTFSKNRHGRFRQSDTFRFVFEQVLRRCIDGGLVGGEGFAIDASVIKADANRTRGVSGAEFAYADHTQQTARAVREYLDALDDANETVTRKNISFTDPAASWTAGPGGPAFYAYSTNYLIDVKAGIVMDVEATTANRAEEVEATRAMIERVESRFGLKPQQLIADTAYGTAPLLGWLVQDKQIEPHMPVWDKSERQDGSLSRADFTYDAQHDRYECPAGKYLNTTGQLHADQCFRYRASTYDCQACELKPRCCPHTPSRKISRSVHETARDVARDLAKTERYRQSRKRRKKVEILFAHLKRVLKLDRLRLRGRSGARDEFLLAAIAQNLRRLAIRAAAVMRQSNMAVA
jgi:transposase